MFHPPDKSRWLSHSHFLFGSSGVFAQVEAYDPVTNKWESLTLMPTPRHGMGAVVIGDTIYIAGGGPVTGGSLMTSTNEAFTLAAR